ncbi:PA14 domain-containing protein [Flexithrix dorotheae]|uniref:PA14 domain-containing protein n=1 Tax=Flexithrix dorotheae TaxID=70993 RepID=UPI0003605F12|nr:PA14 domain-containing protein [Flexithrix dorotheae]
MKYHILLLFLLIWNVGYSQQKDITIFKSEKFEKAVPWTHLNFHNNPDNFQFAIVSDRTGGHREGVFGKAVEKLNLLQPEFVICVGDLIEGYTKDSAVVNEEWDEFHEILKPLEMPFFYLPGNHDFSNAMMKNQWLKRYGRDYYYFIYKDVLFITLNTNDGDGVIFSPEQIEYTKKVLAEFKEVRHTFIFMHHPIWSYGGVNNFTEIEEALQGRQFTVFAGHTHRYLYEKRKGRNYYILASTGGGSRLQGPKFGQFDHFTWVTMTEKEPTVVNLKLDGIINHDISNEETSQMAWALMKSTKFENQVFLNSADGGKSRNSFSNIFSGGLLKLRVENTANKPLIFKGQFFHNHHVAVDIIKIEEEIPPNSTKEYNINLSALKKIPCNDLDPLELDWTIGYKTEKLDHPFEMEGIHKIEINPQPEAVTFKADDIFMERQKLEIVQPFQGINIHYTLDGTEPTRQSSIYQGPVTLEKTTKVKVKLFAENGAYTEVVDKDFHKATPKKAVKKKSKPGLKYSYYEGEFTEIPDFSELKAVKSGVTYSLNVDSLSGNRENHYAFLFEGYVDVPEDGVYTFYLYSDDGSKLSIGNDLVVDNDGSHSAKPKSGQIALAKGKHPLKLSYFEDFLGQTLKISWEGPSLEKEYISFDNFSQ